MIVKIMEFNNYISLCISIYMCVLYIYACVCVYECTQIDVNMRHI